MRLGLSDLAVLDTEQPDRDAERRRVVRVGERKDVRASAPRADDRLSFGERAEPREGVPEHRGAFELLAVGGAPHLRLDHRPHESDLTP